MEEIICEAIRSRISLHFNYRGGGCTVNPYCLGLSAQGAMLLLGYHCSGSELPGTSGQGAGWTTFQVDQISDLRTNGISFPPDKPDPKKRKKIVEIICCADES